MPSFIEDIMSSDRKTCFRFAGFAFAIATCIVVSVVVRAASADDAKPAPPATAPVEVLADGSLLLKPQGARIHGYKLRLEKSPQPAIVNWVDPAEYIEWPKAAKKGKYQVEVTLACPPNAGGEFAVTAAAHRTTGRTENTGDWKTFHTIKLHDPLVVLNDDTSIALRSSGNFNHMLMSVRAVKLIPLPPDKSK